jgi:NitT/TauT family transport system substrate-binding protein
VVAHEYFNEGTLDAYITYPPISTQLLKDENLHVIFDSSKIPFQIMDVLAMKKGDVNKREILFDIWKDTTNYIKQHPEEYAEFLAKLMNSSTGKVKEELAQLIMIDADMQSQVSREDLVELMLDGCKILGEESDACKNQLRKIHFINRPIVEL